MCDSEGIPNLRLEYVYAASPFDSVALDVYL